MLAKYEQIRQPLLCALMILISGCSAGDGTTSANSATGDAGSASSQPAPSGEAPEADRGMIGVSLLTLENPFFKVIGDNVTAEAKKFGYTTNVLSANRDASLQANQVKDFIVQEVVAIVLSPCETKSVVPVIQEANAAGIPVITVDIPCHEPGVEIVTQIATDNEAGGRDAAAAMIEALPAGGKIAILHFEQAESCRLRVKGFLEGIEKHNAESDSKIDIVTVLDGGGLKDIGHAAGQDAITAHPDLAGIFAINDPSALGAIAALEKAGKQDQVVVVGFDGQPEGKQAIKDGKIYADPIQFPDQMGTRAVQAIVKHYKGEEVKPIDLIPTQLYRQADALQDETLN